MIFQISKCVTKTKSTRLHISHYIYLQPVFPLTVFPLGRFFSANQQFVAARANYFWQYSKHSFRKFDKFLTIAHLVYFSTGLVPNRGHIIVFLELWAQLFKENFGTRRLAIKLEGTQPTKPIFFSELVICWSKGKEFLAI